MPSKPLNCKDLKQLGFKYYCCPSCGSNSPNCVSAEVTGKCQRTGNLSNGWGYKVCCSGQDKIVKEKHQIE